MTTVKALKEELNIADPYTKMYRRPQKEQTRIVNNVPLVSGYNYMADILHLPVDKFGFDRLLVVCDIADRSFDIEPMKNKDNEDANSTLKAYERMLKRKIIKIPYASMATDGGGSFKGVFNKFLLDNGVDHKTALSGRHHQLSSVDSLCRTLGELFNSIMNKKELEKGKRSKAWVDSVDLIRTKLNHIRIKEMPTDIAAYTYPIFNNGKEIKDNEKLKFKEEDKQLFKMIKPKYKVGDLVNVLYDEPRDALGKKQNTKNFRMADTTLERKKRKIISVLYYNGEVPFRYLVEGISNASFTENELKQI